MRAPNIPIKPQMAAITITGSAEALAVGNSISFCVLHLDQLLLPLLLTCLK